MGVSKRCSEREPAVSLRYKFNAAGGWLPSLTVLLGEQSDVMRVSHTKSFQDLKITGLDTEHSHAIAGAMVRIYFRLSNSPLLGWSYVFATTWSTVDYPLKRPAGVESGTIWIDCIRRK